MANKPGTPSAKTQSKILEHIINMIAWLTHACPRDLPVGMYLQWKDKTELLGRALRKLIVDGPDALKPHDRTSHIFKMNGKWYFAVGFLVDGEVCGDAYRAHRHLNRVSPSTMNWAIASGGAFEALLNDIRRYGTNAIPESLRYSNGYPTTFITSKFDPPQEHLGSVLERPSTGKQKVNCFSWKGGAWVHELRDADEPFFRNAFVLRGMEKCPNLSAFEPPVHKRTRPPATVF